MNKYCTYLRVSTQRQGAQGLGIEAQRKMCYDFIERNHGVNEQEFMDVESGTHRDRKGLWQAIEYCQRNNVGLVIAKLDRLARDVEFTFKVMNTGIDIHFTDMPVVNSMILGVFASVAQYEREMCSVRTKAALGELKKKGARLGASNEIYRENYNSKSYEEKVNMQRKRGKTKNMRYLESKSVQAFIKALRSVFPDATKGDVADWEWNNINTKGDSKIRVMQLMRDFRELDPTLFKKWDFSDIESTKMQVKLAGYINTVKMSAIRQKLFEKESN